MCGTGRVQDRLMPPALTLHLFPPSEMTSAEVPVLGLAGSFSVEAGVILWQVQAVGMEPLLLRLETARLRMEKNLFWRKVILSLCTVMITTGHPSRPNIVVDGVAVEAKSGDVENASIAVVVVEASARVAEGGRRRREAGVGGIIDHRRHGHRERPA